MSGLADRTAGLPARREPRLVGWFLAVTLLGLLLAGVGIMLVVERTVARQGERQAVERARVTADALLDRRLRPTDLTGAPQPARARQLALLLRPAELGSGSLGATLYASGGTIVSTAARELRTPASPLVERARAGTVVSTVISTRSGQVLRTLLPLHLGAGSTGVVELDQDYGAIAAAARRSSLLAAAVLEALLLVLCVSVLPMLTKAAKRLRRQVAQLDLLASHDELTGLLNRPGFRRLSEETLNAGPQSGALLIADVDRFQEINDAIGSDQGDRLLVEAAARLACAFPDRSLARLGDDEFALLLPGAAQPELAQAAEAITEAFATPLTLNGIRLGIELRIGAAQYPEHGTDPDSLVRHASIALRQAKAEQSSFSVYHDTQSHGDLARLALAAELRDGLARGELVVHYQPQSELATGSIRAVEALIRWQHPQRGLLSPGEFISIAEESGLITDLGRHVLQTSMRQWRSWQAEDVDLDLSVNLSTIDLLDLSLPGTIVDLLIEHEMPADRLILEITERTLLHDERKNGRVLRQLEQIGVQLAIDDFGTGYSSLAALRRLPIRQVKIDRSFIDGIPEDRVNDQIVESTIQLAHALDATVVGEGVETIGQLDRLVALGCDSAQGYLIGDPQPPEQLPSLFGPYRRSLS